MRKITLLLLCFMSASFAFSQISVARIVGKNADQYKTGAGLFAFYEFPLSNENQSIRLELLDFVFFPGIGTDGFFGSGGSSTGYLSIKGGFKHIFSETKTGFYLEPSAGWARVVLVPEGSDVIARNGVALAIEGGYSLEVGERGNTLNLGLKYETDRAGDPFIINSVGLRFYYSFGLFRRND